MRGEFPVYINGRRASPAEARTIAPSAIERIEVLPPGALINGFLAPDGSVNLILK
jgi:outer membrane receptor protein involved in Fe transport